MENVEEKLARLPASPGVYIMKDRAGAVLYIGKAKSLRTRVRSYFRETGDGRYAVRFLAARAEEIDWIVTATEKEALLLEDTLLKQYKPRYNIRLKDSKTYVSIKVTVQDKFPRILVTRQIRKDGARYFGPYISSADVRETIKLIRGIFQLCVCSDSVFRNRTRPCLDYQIGMCSAPAVGLISEEAYRGNVAGAIMFLEGKNKELVKDLKSRMKEAAVTLDFEKAARLRDSIRAIDEMLEAQKVVSHTPVDRDVFAIVREGGRIVIQALSVRGGRLVGTSPYFFEDSGMPDAEVVSSFVAAFYRGERYIPDEVIVPLSLDDAQVIEEWLRDKRGRKAAVIFPERGERRSLLEMCQANAVESMNRKVSTDADRSDVLEELKARLRLGRVPESIEAFDISNIGGELAVGAMVRFANGLPDKGSYRLYRIKGIEGPDDYAMMSQVIGRRYRMEAAPVRSDGAQGADAKADESGRDGEPIGMPDLILIDGGKGQMNMALRALEELGIKGVDVRALAKERDDKPAGKITGRSAKAKGERVFIPNVKDPVYLKEGSRADLLVRRVRDEVHRFAVAYHRRLRSKGITSILDSIHGVGAKKRKALFERFGDLASIVSATVEELMEAAGISEATALEIKAIKTSM